MTPMTDDDVSSAILGSQDEKLKTPMGRPLCRTSCVEFVRKVKTTYNLKWKKYSLRISLLVVRTKKFSSF